MKNFTPLCLRCLRLGFIYGIASSLTGLSTPALSADSQYSGMHNGHMHVSQTSPARPYLKPGAPVHMQSPSEYILAAGDRVPLELALGVLADGEVNVMLKADENLILQGDHSMTVTGQKQVVLPLIVVAEQAALSYVHVFVTFEGAFGQVSRRSFAVAFDSRTDQLLLSKATQPKQFVELHAREAIY